jgi:hypothetical protein
MKLPTKPKKLTDLGDFCRDAIAWMRANQIGNVAGGKLKRTANGTTIEVSPVPKIARGGSVRPLTVIPGSDVDKIRVVPGRINGVMVTLGGDPLDDSPPPELTITAAVTIYLKIVTTYGSPDTHAATVVTTDEGPTIEPTGFTSFRRIAYIEFDDDVATITNITDGGHYDVASFGSVNLWWIA